MRRNRICIRMYFQTGIDLSMSLREFMNAPEDAWAYNRMLEVCVFGIQYRYDINCIDLYLHHPEFPEVREGEECMRFSYRETRRKFPYLFVNTNPLLYRRFGRFI